MKSRRIVTTLSIALGAMLIAGPQASAGDKALSATEIARMAKDARTPAEHTNVARAYLLQAKPQEAKAEKLEKQNGKQQAGPSAAMQQKWPALMNGSREKRERVAMEARRAAQESYRLAEHHSGMAGRTLEQIAALD